MASCSNCGNNGFTTTSTGTIVYSGGDNAYPGAQFGYFHTYPTTCPGGCLYLTSDGYRCSNSTSGTCSGCNSNSNSCGGGCSSCNGGCGNCGCSGIRPL